MAEWTLIFPNSKSLYLSDPTILDLLDELDEQTVIACPLSKWTFEMASNEKMQADEVLSKLGSHLSRTVVKNHLGK